MASAFHKYCIGQTVSFVPGSGSLSHLRGSCTIVRLLPSETRDWQYRVNSDQDTHVRVVLESRLAIIPVKSFPSDPWLERAMKPA